MAMQQKWQAAACITCQNDMLDTALAALTPLVVTGYDDLTKVAAHIYYLPKRHARRRFNKVCNYAQQMCYFCT
tara:strand:- start:265 stop:483 length:219 start_codon:yes stop_codon:yes gene_type:complete